jgi:hypothetical protein
MKFKLLLKRIKFIVFFFRKYLFIRSIASYFFGYPFQFAKVNRIPRYLSERSKFKSAGGIISYTYPITTDYNNSAGSTSGHYFHQDLLVAQFIFEANPKTHIDIGSRIDGFVAHVAAFRKIKIFDIRMLPECGHPNIEFHQADVMLWDVGNEITDSLSCLHTIEHFGLGRYGDSINPRGHITGLENLVKMLAPNGTIYISFPIGNTNEVHFNAHRVFHPRDIFSWAPNSLELLRFDFIDDYGQLHKGFDVLNDDLVINHGCGIYTFKKSSFGKV